MSGKTAGIWTAGILITGNIVGAGILGLPINTGLAGFGLSTASMLLVWALMLGTALILSKRVLESRQEDFDLPSLFGQALGPLGKWLAVGANLLILYGLLVAYLSGGAGLFLNLCHLPFSHEVAMLIFFCLITSLTLFGLAVLQKGNAFLMILMWLAFGGLLLLAGSKVEPSRLTYADPMLLPSALPIMVTAFHFHNIIPTTCRSLDWDAKSVAKALLIGTLIGLGMNLLWNVVVTGSLPVSGPGESNILYAFDHGLPATVPLSKVISSSIFTTVGMVFALLAITTSYMANGTALMGFVRDMFSLPDRGVGRVLTALITFVPPLLVAVFYPGLFLKALDVVGGVGIALLFGVLPGLLLFKDSQSTLGRSLGIVIVACFLVVLLFEMGQELGLLSIDADIEVWKAAQKI